MGTYDLPAALTTVLQVSGKEKATIVGFSQGASQTFYALAKHQDFYADKLHRFVALAPCLTGAEGEYLPSPKDHSKYFSLLD